MSAFSPGTRNAAVAVWNAVFPRLPGSAIFRIAGQGVLLRASTEFAIVLFFSLLPLLTIVFTNWISPSEGSLWAEFKRYTEAGEVFFYVGPIIGASIYLLITEFRRNLNGKKFAIERFWFLLFSIGSLVVSLVMLVVHHLGQTDDSGALRIVSYWIYGVSLYFSFLHCVYGTFEGATPETGEDGAEQQTLNDGLLDFDGETP
jgi:hypothetical protein